MKLSYKSDFNPLTVQIWNLIINICHHVTKCLNLAHALNNQGTSDRKVDILFHPQLYDLSQVGYFLLVSGWHGVFSHNN